MDSNKTAGEEARRQLHKNAASNLEQVLAATPTRHQLYGHLPPITKTIQVRRTRHAGHCWRSRDELISDVLLWTSTHGRAKAGRPARTYIQQLCEDTGCCPEDLPEAMNDRKKWQERVRDIRATARHDDDDDDDVCMCVYVCICVSIFVLAYYRLLYTFVKRFTSCVVPKHKHSHLRTLGCTSVFQSSIYMLVSIVLISIHLIFIYIYIYIHMCIY